MPAELAGPASGVDRFREVLLLSGATIWIGSAFMLHALGLRAKASGDAVLLARIGANAQWLAQRIFIPASLAVLVLGILLTIEGPRSFDQLWILFGLVAYAATFVTGLFFIEPTAKKMHAALESHGPGSPEVERQNRRLDALGVLDLAILFVILWDMALKPTADDVGTLVLGGVVLAAGMAYVLRAFHAPGQGSAPQAEGQRAV